MPRYDVFLSHASADKPAVEHLARKLQEEGIEPFLDIWHLVPGERWIRGLTEALAQSATLAVFIGPQSGGGAWRTREVESALVRAAREDSFRVIPVLLPRGEERAFEEISGFLELHTWVDFRTGLDDEEAFRRFVAGIQGKPPGPSGEGGERPPPPYRCMAPAREPFVQRSEYAKVRDALLLDGAEGSGRAMTVGITTAIHGAGGFGKTALALELCYDEQVRENYPDGILWTTMGEEIDAAGRLARVRDLIRWWTEKDPPAFETVSAASTHLRQELNGKPVLLVVDDVWRPEDVTPFQGLAALLVTTRDSRTLSADSVPIHVDAMEIPEAVRLLGAGLPAGAEAELKPLAALLGEWPLLLKIVNRQVASWISKGLDLQQAIHRAENALKARGLTYFDPKDARERSQASSLTLEVSLERLSPEERKRFTELAIFPEDTNVPLTILEKLWQLDPLDVEELASRLFDLSLLRNFDLRSGTIRLHDVIRAYLLKKGESHLFEWHLHLLDACRPDSGRWRDLPRDESYLWNHLFHHLIGAGQIDVCRALLLDFHYLRSKLSATDVDALLADYSPFAKQDEEFRLVRDALRLSAHVLARNPTELPGQLLGRLLDRQEAGIRSLLQASDSSGAPRLRPRKASLTRPGGALIRTIDHPGAPLALAVLPDGRVVSGSSDGTLRVWDMESGQTLQTLEGHSDWVSAVAVLDSRRVVSGSNDRTLRVWDMESGQTLQTLEGHSDWVSAVAVSDSRRVVSGSDDGTLRVWDVESGQILQTLKVRSKEVASDKVLAVAVLDRRRVVASFVDTRLQGTLLVWDVESGQILKILEGHSTAVHTLAVLDSRRVVSSSSDRTLRVWDVESGQTLKILEGQSTTVRALAVLNSYRVVSNSSDGILRVWDVESGQTLKILEGPPKFLAMAALDNHRLISGSWDEKLRVWDVESGQPFQALEGHSSPVSGMAVLDSRRVVSGSEEGTLRVWDVESGHSLKIFNGNNIGILAMAVLDNHRVVSSSSGGMLQVWDVESGEILKTLEVRGGWDRAVTAVAVLDSRRVVSGTNEWKYPRLQVWDVESGESLKILAFSEVSAVAALDDRRLVSGSHRTLQVWDVESGKVLQTLEVSSSVHALAVADSHRVVSGSSDGTLWVWDVENSQNLKTTEKHSSAITHVAVLNSCHMVSSSSDRTLRVWDVENGEVACLFTLDEPVTALAVIPDRSVIVVGDHSGRVHFFDFVES